MGLVVFFMRPGVTAFWKSICLISVRSQVQRPQSPHKKLARCAADISGSADGAVETGSTHWLASLAHLGSSKPRESPFQIKMA